MTDNFTPILIIPPSRPEFALGVYVPYILKLVIRKFLIPEQRQISFLPIDAPMSETAMLWCFGWSFLRSSGSSKRSLKYKVNFILCCNVLEDCSIVT
jgi:hypothetical protein